MHIADVQPLTGARHGILPRLEPRCNVTEASCYPVHRAVSSWATMMTTTAGTMTTAAGAKCAMMR